MTACRTRRIILLVIQPDPHTLFFSIKGNFPYSFKGFFAFEIIYVVNIQNNSIKNNTSPVEIGAQNWIGGNCIIKKGTKTPKGTIIAGPYSMTSKDYTQIIEEYSLIAGSPAKILIKNVRRVNNIQSEKVLYEHFKNTTEQYIVSPDEFETFCLPTND